MSYDPNIPQSTSKRVISQMQIKANYTSIFNAFARNHSPLGNPDLQGQHNVLTLRPQSSNPTTSATQIAIYNKLVSGVPNIFFRPSSDQTPIQLTYPTIGTSSTPTYAVNQYSFVAGPFVVYTGFITNVTVPTVVTVSPATTLRYVGLGIFNYRTNFPFSLAAAAATGISGSSFTITPNFVSGIGVFDVYYLAIGN